jgi:hypothetical protein
MCGGSTPTDPSVSIAAQQAANNENLQNAARLSAIDQYGPFGSTVWTRDANGLPVAQSTSYSPQLQAYLNDTFGTAAASNDYMRNQYGAGNAYLDYLYPASLSTDLSSQGLLNQRYDAAGNIINRLPGENVTAGDTSAIAQTSYEQAMAKMQPQIDQQKAQLAQSLQDRGIPVGSEVYNNEMSRMDTSVGNLMQAAARQAQLDAGTEQSRQVAMNTSLQMTPYNELAALQAGQYSAQNPNVGASAASYTAPTAQQWNQFQPATTNATGAYSAYDQANAANNQGLLSGLFGIGKAVLGIPQVQTSLFG